MKTSLLRLLLVGPALAATLGATALAAESDSTVKFSDPAKPGTVKVRLGRGELRIEGVDTDTVTVRATGASAPAKPRADGLRELATSSTFTLSEKNNVVSLEGAAADWGKSQGDVRLTVPRTATVVVQNVMGGDVTCTGLAGDLEVSSMQGAIQLVDVAGGVVASTLHGEIRADIRELREGKPLSFSAMHGEVELRVPESAKANLRLRTQNGAVLTDFDDTALVTKAETTSSPTRRTVVWDGSSKVLTREIQQAIREATTLSATAVREALEAVRQGLDESRLNTDEAKRQFEGARQKLEAARREADQAHFDAERTRAEAGRAESERARAESERERRAVARAGRGEVEAVPPAPPAKPAPAAAGGIPRVPVPPKTPIPTVTGGNLVTGTLNGGGPEISVSTMNGDVILRKLPAK